MSALAGAACQQILGYDDLSARLPAPTSEAGSSDNGSSDAGSSDAGSSTCTRSSECELNQICVGAGAASACANVPAQCKMYPLTLLANSGAKQATEPLFVAAFVPDFESGPFLTIDTALDQINRVKLPGARELGVLMCKSTDDPRLVFNTLVETLKIPAILTGFDNELLYEAVSTHPEQTFVLNVSAASPRLVAAGTQGYVLNMLGAIESLASTYPLLVQEATDTIHERDAADADAGGDAGAARALSVRVVYDDTAINNDLGKRVLELLGQTDGICVRQENSGATQPCGTTADSASELLAQQDPDVVVVLVSDKNFETIVHGPSSLEQKKRNECGDNGACLPLWIGGPTNALKIAKYVRDLDTSNVVATTARRRFVGVQYAGPEDRRERDNWLRSMKDRVGANTPASTYASAENYYDALFYLAYGAAAAGVSTEVVEPRSFSIGLKALLPPSPLNDPNRSLYASKIPDSLTTIASQRASSVQSGRPVLFDFFGASGSSSQIDPTSNTWRSVGGVYCIRASASEHFPSYDALRYTELAADGGQHGALARGVAGNADGFCGGSPAKPLCGFATFKQYCNGNN